MESDTCLWYTSLVILISIIIFYLGFHIFYAPVVPPNRRLLKIQRVGLIKNLIIVVSNGILGHWLHESIKRLEYGWCEPAKLQDDEMTNFIFWFYVVRILECSDTIFMSLKGRPVYKLLVFHHVTTVILSWVAIHYVPSGNTSTMAEINCIAHCILYSMSVGGYFSDILGIHYKTLAAIVQNIQFAGIVLICLNALITQCGYPNFASGLMTVYIFLMSSLFYMDLER